MPFAPPNPARDAEIVRLYHIATRREIMALLDISEHVIRAVAKKHGLRKTGPVQVGVGRPCGRSDMAPLGPAISDREHQAFTKATAKSSDALLRALMIHHKVGDAEQAMRKSPTSVPLRLTADPSRFSVVGSSAAMCCEDRGRQ